MSAEAENLNKNSTKCNKWKHSHVNEKYPGMEMTLAIECKNWVAQ
jgi:hypothetical protein